ncbi:hypothetical protein EMA8858_01538 [Emticicia aquatica]|uniref:SdpI family protein n=1 Tax=Emticicia aquatica TaxID=1681835 RepID=A0ABN8ERB7_9BACT|nr:hypothetical protein [Emticicia aquatica]CAH0995417.1 hypothetical protein EMA8858_01538 [Emticicia aquatica]
MKKYLSFELLNLIIVLTPFIYLGINWQPNFLITHKSNLYLYGLALIFFYLLPFFMQYLDSKKPNADFLLRSDKRIRLIWSSYLAALGIILFYYSIFDLDNDKPRFLGVALSLFLFASGNFRQNLHPSSIFANNSFTKKSESLQPKDEKSKRKIQRFTAKLFFWVGICGTIFFLYFNENSLTSWGLIFVGMVIFYGVTIRLIRSII